MDNFEIYFEEDSELAEFESESKGYRNDVFVKEHNTIYKLNIYSMIRLKQDFYSEIESYGYYAIEPNLVLVHDVKREVVIDTILKLKSQNYFSEILATKEIKVENLIKVY